MKKGRQNRLLFMPAALALVMIMAGGLTASTAVAGDNFSYVNYAGVLAKHVSLRGMVDYKGLKANRGRLDDFTQALAELDPALFSSWTSKGRIAFWINAYNALTLKAIIDHYPIKASAIKSVAFPKNSIRQIPGVWKKLTFTVMGETMTLDQIEHEMLRKQYDEPRIHVALVCAALGCPTLRREPYTGGRLSEQLNDQARKFLADPRKFRVDQDADTVYLSSIFKWFGKDFEKSYGVAEKPSGQSSAEAAVINFILRYLKGEQRDFVASGDFEIEYLDYDWTLNEGA